MQVKKANEEVKDKEEKIIKLAKEKQQLKLKNERYQKLSEELLEQLERRDEEELK